MVCWWVCRSQFEHQEAGRHQRIDRQQCYHWRRWQQKYLYVFLCNMSTMHSRPYRLLLTACHDVLTLLVSIRAFEHFSLRCVRLSVPSVCLSGTSVHCDHTVHFRADLTLQLDSPMFRAPWHKSMSTYSRPSFFHFHLEERWGMDAHCTK